MTVFLLTMILAGGAWQHSMVMFHYPRWSPDGQSLVFTTNIDGDDEVWVISRDGSQGRKLTDNAVSDINADWHPDGRHVVFQRHGANGVENLIMNADGSDVRPYQPPADNPVPGRLTVEERRTADGQALFLSGRGSAPHRISAVRWAEQPSLSPDGRYIVFEQRDDPNDVIGSDIAVWDAQTERARTIARGTDPSWLRDGHSILFKTPRGAHHELFIATVDIENGRVRIIAPGVHPHLSPDGKWIAYMSDRPDRTDVYVIGIDGTGQRCLTCSWT